MKQLRKHPLLISMMLVLVFSLSAGVKTDLYPVDGEKIIEVCRHGIVYLPPGTKYVKCMGEVKKILRITPYLRGDESCICPKCCEGECSVIVSCDASLEVPDSGPNGSAYNLDSFLESGAGLCTVWLACDTEEGNR